MCTSCSLPSYLRMLSERVSPFSHKKGSRNKIEKDFLSKKYDEKVIFCSEPSAYFILTKTKMKLHNDLNRKVTFCQRVTPDFLTAISRCWIAQQLYGWEFAPTICKFEYPFFYAKCVLFISNANGTTHRVHRNWVNGLVQASFTGDTDPSLIEFIKTFERSKHEAPSFNEVSIYEHARERLSPLHCRLVLYDALKASVWFDGEYDDSEALGATHVSKEFGVSRSVMHSLSVLCLQEYEISERKRKLLFGDPGSSLDPQRPQKSPTPPQSPLLASEYNVTMEPTSVLQPPSHMNCILQQPTQAQGTINPPTS